MPTRQATTIASSEVGKYNDEEFVCEEIHAGEKIERRRKKYEKGTFIFRLAGRDRQKSASYYTPKCLTQCVVKYALKELLKDKKADDILMLTVCEPAMGSGAFLNEAVNYVPACSPGEYRRRTPKFNGKPVTDFYRHVNRQMVSPTGERTQVNTIIPPGAGHILSVFSLTFSDYRQLLLFSGFNASLCLDFYVKCSSKQHVILDLVAQFPILSGQSTDDFMIDRTLRLNCLPPTTLPCGSPSPARPGIVPVPSAPIENAGKLWSNSTLSPPWLWT